MRLAMPIFSDIIGVIGALMPAIVVIDSGPVVAYQQGCFRLHDIVPTAYPNHCLVGVLFDDSSSPCCG